MPEDWKCWVANKHVLSLVEETATQATELDSASAKIESPGAGIGPCAPPEAKQAAFDGAQIMGVRDDLLTSIAALIQGYSAQSVQIQHLRHESLSGRRRDRGQAGANIGQAPKRLVLA
jgi:hypothetical protein